MNVLVIVEGWFARLVGVWGKRENWHHQRGSINRGGGL
jgi:hypothetical protein